MLSSRIFTSMVSVGAPGMANSTTSFWFSPSAYATVLGATLIRSSIILPSPLTCYYPNILNLDIPRRPQYTPNGAHCDRILSPRRGSGLSGPQLFQVYCYRKLDGENAPADLVIICHSA